MPVRFRPSQSVPEYLGVSGGSGDNALESTVDRRFPTSDDGTLTYLTTFRDLKTGEWWFWNGESWQPMTTPETLMLQELRMLQREVREGQQAMVALLTEVRDLLQKIA